MGKHFLSVIYLNCKLCSMQKQTLSNNNLINLPFYTKLYTHVHQNISHSKILAAQPRRKTTSETSKTGLQYHKWLRNDGITSLVDLLLIVKQPIEQVQPEMLEIPWQLRSHRSAFNSFYLLETFLKCLIFFVLHLEMLFLIDSIIFEYACSNEQLFKVLVSYDQPTLKL